MSRAMLLVPAVVLAAGCGGGGVDHIPPPRLHARDAAKLIALSNTVARDAAVDPCGARRAADELQTQTNALVSAARVPAPLRARLLAGVAAVVQSAPACVQAPAPVPTHDHKHPEKHEKHAKHEKHEKDEKDKH